MDGLSASMIGFACDVGNTHLLVSSLLTVGLFYSAISSMDNLENYIVFHFLLPQVGFGMRYMRGTAKTVAGALNNVHV